MSRIHEALKKAEQERAAIATAETEVAPLPDGISNGSDGSADLKQRNAVTER